MACRIPRKMPGLALEQLDDEVLLYHAGQTRTVHLNETASLLWQLCDGTRSSEEIVALLWTAFSDQSEQQIADDVEAALTRLACDGAIEFL